MSYLETLYCRSHGNIYINSEEARCCKREVRVEVGIPDNGTSQSTGLLILIPGYGGNIDSHVYQRMRAEFPDMYNLVTMQCDYFGNKYMGAEAPPEVKNIYNIKQIEKGYFTFRGETGESIDEFNDMGIMQALDIVSTTLDILFMLKDRNYIINTKRIILFGVSHGAYIAHLANLICPDLYNFILDISAYVKPYYLDIVRSVFVQDDRIECQIVLEQFLNKNPQYRYRDKLYDISYLYSKIKNRCKIIALQGKNDPMVKAQEKVEFIKGIDNAEILVIGDEDVDGIMCKNAQHGVGLDFFEFFKVMIPLLDSIIWEKSYDISIPEEVLLGDEETHFLINFCEVIPKLVEVTF